MFLTNLFNLQRSCNHDKVLPNIDFGYCPDCGRLIQNEWYITRCSCCGVKLRAVVRRGNIEPQNHYCSNCGGEEFFVEKLPSINIVDINFAVLQKREVEEKESHINTTQCWQEKTVEIPKLQVKYL